MADATNEDLSRQKLALEIAELRRKGGWADQLVKLTPLLSVLILAGGFVMSTVQFTQQIEKDRSARAEAEKLLAQAEKREAEARTLEQDRESRLRERELFRPLWEQQIRLLFEASEVASTLATSSNPAKLAEAKERFWILYEGPLCVVESKEVAGRMKALGKCLDGNQCDMRDLSRQLATAVLNALAESWKGGLGDFEKTKFQYH